MNWLRLYHGTLDDPKVQRLPGDVFKVWINLLCLAGKNAGELPCVADIAFALRLSVPETEAYCNGLVGDGLLDRRGNGFTPHNWANRQKPSDSSTKRVRKHRGKASNGGSNDVKQTVPAGSNGHGTASVTLHETDVEQPGNALDQKRTEENREERSSSSEGSRGADDDDENTFLGIFERLTGRRASPSDQAAEMYLYQKGGVYLEDVERGVALAIERAPGKVNSLRYCVPVIEEVAAARVQAAIGAAAVVKPDAWGYPAIVLSDAVDPNKMIAIGQPVVGWSPGPEEGELASEAEATVAPTPGRYSETEKAPVFAATTTFVRQFAAMNGRQPDRDELRAHLIDWCLERKIDVGIVDAMYPAVVATAKPK